MIDRTGETGEPWGVPTVKIKGSDVLPLNLSLTVRSLRKDRHQLVSSGAKPRLEKVWISLSWLMLSKNPCMSNRSKPVLSPAWWAARMSCRRVSPASRVDEAFRPPNWLLGTRACVSISL